MILADSSAWIEFDRATGSRLDVRMIDLVAEANELFVTEPVVMEVLLGATSERREAELRRFLGSFPWLPFDATQDFDNAVRLYRRCRRVGVTPRGVVDCMIAGIAERTGAALLAQDADLARVADVIGVELDTASLPA